MSLPEDKRQEYLQALGITTYFPRVRLPGAPETLPCDWPASWTDAGLPEEASADDQARPQQKDQKDQKDQKLQKEPGAQTRQANTQPVQPPDSNARDLEMPVEAVRKAKPADKPRTAQIPKTDRAEPIEKVSPTAKSPDTPVKAKKEDIRLQLLCIRVNDSLAIVNAMPHFGPGKLSVQHRKLLQNVLGTTGINHDGLQVEEKPFHWPMVQGEHVDNSKNAAAIALTAYLQQKMADWQFSKLLVMGDQVVAGVFSSDEELDGQKKTASSLDGQPWQTFYTRSLDEILQSPALKKEAWTVIRKLTP